MRIRQIKPDFSKHVGLGELKRDIRLLFIHLWQLADCSGRLEDQPKRIKAEAFPYDEDINHETVDQWLDELANASDKFIIRYEIENKKYIQISKFREHQHLMGNEAKAVSKYPEPYFSEEVKNSTYSVLTSTTDIRSNGYTDIRSNGLRQTKFDEVQFQTAEFIFEKVLFICPDTKKPNLEKWANDIRLMQEQDKRSVEDIKELYLWAFNSSFWKSIILSPAKLREKWTQLSAQKNNPQVVTSPKPFGSQIPGNRIVPAHEREGGSGKL